jgi:hypothetical protein
MKLHEVIAAFQREIDAARGKGRPFHARLELQVAVEQANHTAPVNVIVLGRGAAERAPTGGAHTLVIDFDPARESSSPNAAPVSPDDSAPAPHPHNELHSALAAIFGPPGFDSAARASVFCEIIENLKPSQLEALLAAFTEDSSEVPLHRPPDADVATARTRIARLLKLGPAGFPAGLASLLRLLNRPGGEAVVRTLREHWKTQSDWIDTTPPGVGFSPGNSNNHGG